jgi:hypothetical protein
LEQLLKYIAEHHWGELANILSLAVSLIGFVATLWNLIRAKRAAQRAEEAVKRMREMLRRSDTIMEVALAIRIMEEVKRLHWNGEWRALLDRYTSLRTSLIGIRSANPHLKEDQQAILTGAINQFRDIENKVARAIEANTAPPKVSRLNSIVSSQIDRLAEVLGTIRQEVGTEHYAEQDRTTDQTTPRQIERR